MSDRRWRRPTARRAGSPPPSPRCARRALRLDWQCGTGGPAKHGRRLVSIEAELVEPQLAEHPVGASLDSARGGSWRVAITSRSAAGASTRSRSTPAWITGFVSGGSRPAPTRPLRRRRAKSDRAIHAGRREVDRESRWRAAAMDGQNRAGSLSSVSSEYQAPPPSRRASQPLTADDFPAPAGAARAPAMPRAPPLRARCRAAGAGRGCAAAAA